MRTATVTRNTSETQITARFQAAFCALNQTYSDWAGKKPGNGNNIHGCP